MAEAVTITTSDGESLEAELFLPESPVVAVVITHPHPLMGGDMYTPVPGALFAALGALGAAGLRFNFRGVGSSTGTHDEGQAEQLDVQAALSHLAQAAPGVPIVLAGWSFGADVSLAIEDDRVAGWFAAAAPLRVVDPTTMAAQHSAAPKVLAVPENDQFTAPDVAAERTSEWTNTSIQIIADADHFFGAQIPALIEQFNTFIKTLTSDSA